MIKRLTKHGNSYALIIDKAILELLKISPDSQLEISTDGQALLIERVDPALRQTDNRDGKTLREPAAPESAPTRRPPHSPPPGRRQRAKLTLRGLRRHRDAILELAARHGARNVRVFGSVLRGNARPDSDVDLLVEMDPDRSLIDRTALMHEIEDLIGYKVDVVNERALNPLIRDRVLDEGVAL